jgi:hypothetical protein
MRDTAFDVAEELQSEMQSRDYRSAPREAAGAMHPAPPDAIEQELR